MKKINVWNMTKLSAISLLVAVFGILSSCSKDDNPPAISVANNQTLTQEVYADNVLGKSGVTFTTTGAWTSRISTSSPSGQPVQMSAPANSSDWVSISPDRGNAAGNYTIAISLEVNTTGANRTATITILCNGDEIKITVTQKGTTKDGDVPSENEEAQVATNACNESDITETTAIVSANVTKAGEPPYTERGICWTTHSNPTVSDNKQTANGSGQSGSYSCTITGLTTNTTYYAKAYLIQNGAAIYGNEISFKTKETEESQLRALLVKLYNDTKGAGWTNKTNWLSDKPINEWFGITYSTGNLKIDLGGNNLIGTIDVSGCKVLTELVCFGNQLTSLNVSGCSALMDLSCNNSQLTSLNANGCTALTSLRCASNQLTSLNLSGCTALISLTCNFNQVASLDLSTCVSLTTLYCTGNLLENLDVSSCPALTSLICQQNQLTNTALNTVFGMLPDRSPTTNAYIDVSYNPGSSSCNPSIAEAKGWIVLR